MSLFADFSFASPPSRATGYQDVDMDSISPSSSRSASPSASSIPDTYSPTFPPRRVSVAELTSSLDRTNLLAPAPSLALRLQTQSSRRSSGALLSPTSSGSGSSGSSSGGGGGLDGHFDSVRRRRAEGARLHCSGARLASIETLVDRMLRDGSSCYASLHPSSSGGSRRRGPTSAPTSVPVSPTVGVMGLGGMSSSGEEDSEAEVEGEEPRASPVVGRGSVVSLKGAGRRSGVEKRRGGGKRR